MPPNPVRFEPIETLPVGIATSLPSSLQPTATPVYYKPLVLRLLAGTLKIRCNKTNKEIAQQNNYSTLPFSSNSRVTKNILVKAVRPKSLIAYDKLIKASLAINRRFYTDIYFEFCGYFFQQSQQNYTAAFVHLYRVLERISYAVPLFWAARAKEYDTTFTTLRSYLSDPKIGEIGFFKKFVPEFIDSSYLSLQVNLNVLSGSTDWQQRHYTTLTNLIRSTDIVAATAFSQITIRYKSMLELMLNLRNRYFHALTGQSQSFGSEDVMDFDELCGPLNEDMANWLSFILFQIFDFELR